MKLMPIMLFLFFQLNLSSVSFAQQKDNRPQIDSIIASYMKTHEMVGLSIGIVKDGKIYLNKGYGNFETGKIKPVDSLTNFLTCSVTKLFTATALMQLSEQGKIDISKKLIDYIPDFKMKDKRYVDITIEQMLTHSSGLYWDMELKKTPNDSSALRKLVYSLDTKILDFAPGTKFDATRTYSNAAYDILGYLVQKFSGMQYDEYIRKNILQKTGMKYSSILLEDIPAERRSVPHLLKKGKPKVGGMYIENREHSPSGNLNSCSRDLCYWMMHILDISNHSDSTEGILQKETLDKMWTSKHIAPQNAKVSIGLGWFIKDSDNYGKYYWHVGDNPGFSSTLMVFPEYDFGITIMTNGMYAEDIVWNKIPFDILDLLKDEFKK